MNKKGLIAIIVIVAIVVLAGGGTAAFFIMKAQGGNNVAPNTAGFELAENQEFSYDGGAKQPTVNNLSDEDRARIVYSYAKKTGDNPEDHTYTQGLPVDAGTYFVKVSLDEEYKFTTLSIIPSSLRLEDLSVVYSQMVVGSDYFTSEFDIDDVEFSYLFTINGEPVDGTLTLDADALVPSVSTYSYTFTPTNKNYAEYRGSVDIRVYATISLFRGEALEDYREVAYGSAFEDGNYPAGHSSASSCWVDADGVEYTNETRIYEDTTLFLQNRLFVITYHLDGGTNGTNPSTFTVEDDTIHLATADKTGYNFVGWYLEPEFEHQVTKIEIENTLHDVVLYAKFETRTYSVTYDLSGGFNSENNPSSVTIEDVVALEDAQKIGHNFVGWYVGDEKIETLQNVSSNITLTAHFEIAHYTIKFEPRGGTPVEDLVYEYGEEVNVPTDNEKTGYTFNGWYTDEDCTEIFKDTQMPAKNLTLYAKFTPIEYAITYHLDDGTNGDNPYHYTIEQSITFAAAQKTGHTFGGWYSESTFDNQVTGISQGTTGEIELYAKFVPIAFTVTFATNGGDAIAPIGANYGETIALPVASKLGYDFDGWFDDDGLTSPVASPYAITQNVTLYAKYTIETYQITYYLNGGENGVNPTSYTVESDTIVLAAAQKAGHTFVGWYSTSALTGDVVGEIAHGSTGNKSLYAKFEINVYTVTFETNGGDAIASIDANYGEIVNLPAAQRAGYNFIAWYDATLTTPYSNSFALEDDLTVYAKYEVVQYTIGYELNGGTNADGNPTAYNVESETLALQPANKAGYDFGGWYDNAGFEGSAVVSVASGSTGNKVLYAKFTPISYAITYNLGGGTNGANPASYTIESDTIVLADAQKTGYTFVGWYLEAGFENKVTEIAHGSTGAVELFAKYNVETYSITYNLNGGTNGANPASYTIESATIVLADAQKTGYTFAGWYLEAGFENEVTEIAHGAHGNVELFAKFVANDNTQYLVKHYTEKLDGTFELCQTEEKHGVTDTNTQAAFKTIAHFTPIGEVEQANIAGDGSTIVELRYSRDSYTVTFEYSSGLPAGIIPANQTKTVKYEQTVGQFPTELSVAKYSYEVVDSLNNPITNATVVEGDVTYYVVYTLRSLSIEYHNVETPIATQEAEAGSSVTLATTSKAGYTFIGWATTAGGAKAYDGGETITMPDDSLDLYALWEIITYTITYHLDGGTNGANPASYTIETATITLAGATKTGYAFGGWYLNGSYTGSAVENITIGSTGDVELYAKFTIINYAINYVLDGGTNGTNPSTYTVNDAVVLANASKDYYDFGGWYVDNTFETPATGIALGSTGERTFYAKFTPTSYTITYDLDGGTNGANPASYNVESATINLAGATKNGYSFVGWYTEAGFVNKVTSIAQGSHGDVELFAKFSVETYTITYNLNGGTNGANPASYTVESATINLVGATKNGYNFGGWYDNSGFTGSAVTSIANGSTGNKVLYAKFTPVVYTISYNNVSGLSNPNPTSYTIETPTFTLQSVNKDYYTFGGWYDNSGFTGSAVTSIANGSTGNKVFFAKFTPIDYSITYNLNGGTNGANPASYNVESATINLVGATKNGYTFGGWYSNSGFTGSAVTSIAQGSHGNVELYAKFTPISYQITYNLNGGTNGANPATYTIETSTITLASATKNGYVFEGWYTEAGFVNKVTQIVKGSTGNLALYANFVAENYPITYVLNGGTNGNNPATYTINDTIVLENASKEGYDFIGWYLESTFTTPISQISARTGALTIFAKFELKGVERYYITYVLNGGENNAQNPASYTQNDASFMLKDPSKGNAYTFAGWYLENTFATRIISIDTDEMAENITVYAKWTPLQYTILYYDGSERITTLTRNTYTIEDSFALENYNKFNHTFGGWYTDSTLTTPMSSITAGTTGTIRLYAKTTDNGFTVKFYDTNKTTLLDTKNCVTYGSVTAPSYSYDNATYILKWVDANGIEQPLTNIGANLNLHAELIVISYTATVYYVDADGYALARTGNTSITNKSVGNLTFGNNISLTRQMRVTDTSAYDLFYMSPVSAFDWSLAVTSIATGAAATATDGTMAAHVSISGTSGTLTIFVFCVQPVAIVTASSTTLPYENNLDMSTSTYQFYKTIDEAFEAFAATSKLLRIYGRSNGTISSHCLTPTANTTINAASTTVNGIAITRPKLVYNYSDYTLHDSYTINGNILLPYNRKCTDTAGYITKSSDKIQSANYVHSLFVVGEGVTLTIKNTMTIGADIYGGSSIGGRGVVINNGTIVQQSGSTLNSYGYLKGTGNLIVNSGAILVDYFKIYDWPGGANALGFYNKNIFPFEVYSFHNVACDTRIYSGATYKAWNQLYMADTWVADYLTLVGSGGLFQLSSGYIDKSIKETTTVLNTKTNYTATHNDQSVKDVFEIHGNFSDNSISVRIILQKAGITLADKTVETSTTMALPIGFLELTISEGTGTLSKNSYKFLPGSKLVIGKYGRVNISSGVKVIFYDEYPDSFSYTDTDGSTKDWTATSWSYQNRHSAIYTSGAIKDGYHPELIVNGTLSVSGNLGGKISTSSATGTVTLSATSAALPKATALSYGSTGSSCTASSETVNASIYLYSGGSFAWTNASATVYSSVVVNGEFGFTVNNNVTSFTLTYNSVSGTSSTTINTTSSSYTLTEGDLPALSVEGYTFGGWYVDSGYETSAVGHTISSNTTVYAKMTPIVYNVEYHAFILDDYDDSVPIVNTNRTYVTVEEPITLVSASCGDLNFNGWYIDEQFSVNAPNITSNTLTYYKMLMDEHDTIHLYGYFSSIAYYSIVYRDTMGIIIDSIESQTVVEGTTITFAAALPAENRTEGVDTNLYAYERYTFSKWVVFNSNGTQIGQYNAGASYTPTSSITVVPYFVSAGKYVRITPGNLSNASYTVSYSGGSGSSSAAFVVPVGTSLSFTITYSESENKSYTYAPASGNSSTGSGTSLTKTADYNATMSASSEASSSCIVKGTLITLADGTTTEVENVQAGDLILVFNHETGEYDVSMVMFNDAEPLREQVVINLFFANGAYVGVVSEHGFFDLDLMKYVYITEDNYWEYVGHRFYAMDGETVLEDAYLTIQEVEVYSPVTAVHLNLFTNGLLSMPGGVPGLFNIFEYGDDLKYDEEKMNADIEEYGLLDYSFFEDMIPYDVYIAFNGKYLGIAMAKGILTEENLAYYVERYSKFW